MADSDVIDLCYRCEQAVDALVFEAEAMVTERPATTRLSLRPLWRIQDGSCSIYEVTQRG